MANDFDVRVSVSVDESELQTLEESLNNIKREWNTIDIDVDVKDANGKIQSLFNKVNKVFDNLNITPNINTQKIRSQISEITRLLNASQKAIRSNIDPNSLLKGSESTLRQLSSRINSQLPAALTKIGNVNYAADIFNIDTSNLGIVKNGLKDAEQYLIDFKNAANSSNIAVEDLSDGSIQLSRNIEDVATQIVTFNNAGERTNNVVHTIQDAFDVVSGSVETFNTLLNQEQKSKIFDSIKTSLKEIGVEFENAEQDISSYIKKISMVSDSSGNLLRASVQSSYKGIDLTTNLSTKDIFGESALTADTAFLVDNRQTQALKELKSEYSQIISLTRQLNTAQKNNNSNLVSTLNEQIQKHEENAEHIKTTIQNQEELNNITQKYNDTLEILNAKQTDTTQKQIDTEQISNITSQLKLLEQYQQKINTLQKSGTFNASEIEVYQNAIQSLVNDMHELGISYDTATNKFNTSNIDVSNITQSKNAIDTLTEAINEFQQKVNINEAKQQDYVDQQKINEAITLLEELQRKKLELAKEEVKGGSSTYINKLKNDINELEQKLNEATNAQTKYNSTVGESDQYQTAFANSIKQTEDAMAKLQSSAQRATSSTQTLNNGFDNLIANSVRMAASFAIFDQLQNAIYSSISAVQELDATMTGLQMVTEQSDESITNMMANYATMAKDLGVTLETVAEGSEEWLNCLGHYKFF